MSALALLLAGAGGAAGACTRAVVLQAAQRRGVAGDRAVSALNALGSLLAGMALAASLSPAVAALLVAGVLGALTTLSTWIAALAAAHERPKSAVAWATADLVVGMSAALAGHALVA